MSDGVNYSFKTEAIEKICRKIFYFIIITFEYYFAILRKNEVQIKTLLLFFISVELLVSWLLLTSLFPSVLAQNATEGQKTTPPKPQGNITGNANTTTGIILNTTSTNIPLLSNVSDKGNYKVQLRWGQSPNLLSQNGFDMEILFLNASAPEPTSQTIPQKETNLTGQSSVGASGYTEPSIIQRTVAVDSFDITIYSDKGEILWQKVNQAVTAGRAPERVIFTHPYVGGVTIQINNIKSAGITTDSVTFPAKVVVQ